MAKSAIYVAYEMMKSAMCGIYEMMKSAMCLARKDVMTCMKMRVANVSPKC